MTRAWLFRGLVGLVIATLATAYLLRDDIFQTLQDPGQPFQTYAKPPAPDYSQSNAWIARPDLDRDPAELVVKGDVFVVVPEVYKGSEHWNLPIEDDRRREKLLKIVRPNYVDPYRDAGRLFAPYYRQAALYAFLNNREDSQAAQDLAYSDVLRAFDVFTSASPPERPIVLVGHGQGAAHAQRLLLDRFQGELRQKLAVAYIIDHPLPRGLTGELPACESAKQTACVVSWNTVMPGERTRPARLRERALVYGTSRYEPVGGRPIICTNPLSWRTDGMRIERDAHLGGVSAIGFEPDLRPTVHARQVGAQCVDGVLEVDRPSVASLRRPRKLGGKFRTLPSNLFYDDLRVNAEARVEALIASGTLPERAPLLAPLGVEEVEVEAVTPAEEN